VFLSNLTDDANMFYRAERFLSSDIRTPLKTDNPVVEWIHGKFRQYYERIEKVNDKPYTSSYTEHKVFLKQYLVDDLGYEPLHQLLTDPPTFFEARMDDPPEVPTESILSTELVDETIDALNAHVAQLGESLSDIESYFGMEGGNVVRGEDAIDTYVREVQTSVLSLIEGFLGQAQGYQSKLDDDVDDGLGQQIESELQEMRAEAAKVQHQEPEQQLSRYSDFIAQLFGMAGQLMRLRGEASKATESSVPQVRTDLLDSAKQAVDQLETLIDEDQLKTYYDRQREVFYLKSALREVRSYVDGYGKPYMSLYAVKNLLRSAYYLDRYLRATGSDLGEEVWFVPPDYYGSSGQFMTVFRGDDDISGSEESIDSIVSTFTPYRSEYQSEAGEMQAFLPHTTVTEDGVEFAFERYVTGEERDGILVPDSIQTSSVTDLADSQALNIVRYCPVCLQIISNDSSCLRHGESALGKVHSDAQVSTRVTDRENEGSVGGLSLADVSAEVTLDGVSLEITPANWMGPEIGYRFTGDDRISREIESPSTPLGFRLDTRGLIFDISSFVDDLDGSVRTHVERYKDVDDDEFEYLVHHTAAHFFLQLVADISSVNTTNLLYGFDESRQEVYVFERTEGGQGIVDLVFEELRTDPASVLESLSRVAYNPQVITERLWADAEFVETVATGATDEGTVATAIADRVGVPYDEVLEQVTQESIATLDRCQQLATDADISLEAACEIKSTVAREQVHGVEEFPRAAVLECKGATEELTDRITNLFYSPDIDGCVENLQLTECMASGEQSEALSYIVLEALRSHLVTAVPSEEATEAMFDRELPPAGDYDGTSIFLDF
jgi:hypothetical protein